jgi:hypothetical protein
MHGFIRKIAADAPRTKNARPDFQVGRSFIDEA